MNQKELEIAILRSGKTKDDVIRESGISKKSFYAKIKGKVEFKRSEMVSLVDVLGLNKDDIIRIFFTK
jgi:hypothetical protein